MFNLVHYIWVLLRKDALWMIGIVRKEKGASQDIDLEGLPQNWHFLTFPEPFLAARGHSLRNPDAFRSSVPAYNPM